MDAPHRWSDLPGHIGEFIVDKLPVQEARGISKRVLASANLRTSAIDTKTADTSRMDPWLYPNLRRLRIRPTGTLSFPHLTHLDCKCGKLTSVDLSGCPQLTHVFCLGNQLTSLDLSACPRLTWLDCNNNRLTMLNLAPCPLLAHVCCDFNPLTALNLAPCNVLAKNC